MDKEQVIKALAEYFNIRPDDDGEYDLGDYDWTSGCYSNGVWFSLANVVECLEKEGLIW